MLWPSLPMGKCAHEHLATATAAKSFLWDVTTGKKRATLLLDSAVQAMTFSTDGKYLVTAAGKMVHLWDAEAGKDGHVNVDKPVRSLEGHTDTVLALACPRMEVSKESKQEPKDGKSDAKDVKPPDAKPEQKEPKSEAKDLSKRKRSLSRAKSRVPICSPRLGPTRQLSFGI